MSAREQLTWRQPRGREYEAESGGGAARRLYVKPPSFRGVVRPSRALAECPNFRTANHDIPLESISAWHFVNGQVIDAGLLWSRCERLDGQHYPNDQTLFCICEKFRNGP
jgi:hypothetical protein